MVVLLAIPSYFCSSSEPWFLSQATFGLVACHYSDFTKGYVSAFNSLRLILVDDYLIINCLFGKYTDIFTKNF